MNGSSADVRRVPMISEPGRHPAALSATVLREAAGLGRLAARCPYPARDSKRWIADAKRKVEVARRIRLEGMSEKLQLALQERRRMTNDIGQTRAMSAEKSRSREREAITR